MAVFALIPQLFIIAVALLMTAVFLGVVAVRRLPGWHRRAQLKRDDARHLADRSRFVAWRAGDDLMHYPERLLQQEDQLTQARLVALQRVVHLGELATAADAKGGRAELAERYRSDADQLAKRAEDMTRLIAQLWRARALLSLRIHAAVTARSAPKPVVLPALVDGAAEDAATRLVEAATEVRGFLVEVSNRLAALDQVGADQPNEVVIPAEMVEEVNEERAGVAGRYRHLIERMDSVADELEYLMERCRTQAVLEQVEQVSVPEAGHLTSWADAVAGLDGIGTQIAPPGGDLDDAIAALDEGIGALERSGHDARAHADAAIEVERLLARLEP